MYVIEPSPAAEEARGKRVLVREDGGGQVFIEYRGVMLAARAFPKDARVHQSAIVDNKLLGHTLTIIQAMQRQRDENALRTTKLTLRDEDLMRKAMGQVGLSHWRAKKTHAPAQAPTRKPILDPDAEPDNCTSQSAGHL